MCTRELFKTRPGRLALILCIATFAFAYTGCARSPQAKRDKHLAAGMKMMGKKDYHSAILEFQNAVQAMPQDAEARYQLGLAFAESGDTQHAYGSLKRAVELDPKNQRAQLKLAQIMATSRDPDIVRLGQDELKKLADADATPEVLNSLALTQLKLGEVGDAVQSLQEALTTSPQGLSSSIMLALAKLSQNDAAGAEQILKKACDSAPKSADPHTVLGEFYAAQHRLPEAKTEFQRAMDIDSKSYRALLDLARLQNATGDTLHAEQNFKRLAASGDESLKPIHALFLFHNGQLNEAVAEFEILFKQNPGDRQARTRLVAAYEAAHRTSDAEKILAQALKKNSHDTDALLQRAVLFQTSGKYAEAEKDLDEVLHARPDSADAHYSMSKLHRAQGQALSERQDLSEAVRLNPNLFAARLELAQLLVAAKDTKAALDLLDHTPEERKASVQWLTARNWVLWSSRDMAELRKGIDRGLATMKTPDLLVQDGLWKLTAGDFPRGRASLEEALKIAPGDVGALVALYRSYVVKKEPSVGLVKVIKHASDQPHSAPMQEYLGNVLMENGDHDRARAAFNAAKAADARFVTADFSLVQLDMVEKKLDDAQKRLKTILATDERNSMAYLWLGMAERMAGHPASALEEYRKAVAADAQNIQALNNLAYILADYANKPDEALSYAEKARELDPANPHIADTLGWIYYCKGMYSSAVKQMETGESENQGDAVIKYHLAMAYTKAGDGEKGMATWLAAMKLNPNLPEARVAASVVGVSR